MILSLFHDFINVSPRCNHRCQFCTYWSMDGSKISYIHSRKKIVMFCRKFKTNSWLARVSSVHIVGGEPLQSPLFFFILTELKKYKVKVFVWSNLFVNQELLRYYVPFVDYWFVYLPSSDKEQYRLITGSSDWEVFNDNLVYLYTELKSKVFLHFPIRSDNIQECADVYDYAYHYKVPLLLHYTPVGFANKDSVDYITRFYRVPNVWVVSVSQYLKLYCQVIPILSFKNSWQWIKNMVYNLYSQFTHPSG